MARGRKAAVTAAEVPWPTREEWQANAEAATRQSCLAIERVPNGVEHYLTADELAERDLLRVDLAKAAKPLLTAGINRLRALIPDCPSRTSDRVQWLIALEASAPERAEAVQGLHRLEVERRTLTRYLRDGTEPEFGGGCPFMGLTAEQVADPRQLARLRELDELHRHRLAEAATCAEQAAVDREVARRQADEAWESQLRYRRRVDQAR